MPMKVWNLQSQINRDGDLDQGYCIAIRNLHSVTQRCTNMKSTILELTSMQCYILPLFKTTEIPTISFLYFLQVRNS